MSDLEVSFELETPTGWLLLEDPEGGYELHKDSFASRAVSHRKQEVSGEWIEGSYVTRSVRENVTEDVAIWVGGETFFDMDDRVQALVDGLEQLGYGARKVVGDLTETWTCSVADYTIECSQEYMASTVCLVRAKIPRLPAVVRTMTP